MGNVLTSKVTTIYAVHMLQYLICLKKKLEAQLLQLRV